MSSNRVKREAVLQAAWFDTQPAAVLTTSGLYQFGLTVFRSSSRYLTFHNRKPRYF